MLRPPPQFLFPHDLILTDRYLNSTNPVFYFGAGLLLLILLIILLLFGILQLRSYNECTCIVY